jgi:hypothetical protein
MEDAVRQFWSIYYSAIREGHIAGELPFTVPVHGRNQYTTTARHVRIIEDYCADVLAASLGVSRSEVGPRRIRLSENRTKDVDVCWPLDGTPKILISVKSMQNAYRNLTNRIEEAYGDLALLRMYKQEAVFGFFYLILDGPVARGEVGQKKHGQDGRVKPFTALVEDGGDYLEGPVETVYSSKADTIQKGVNVLLDMVSTTPIQNPLASAIRYDAIAFVPTSFSRSGIEPLTTPEAWNPSFSEVDDLVSHQHFFERLLECARVRGFLV